MPGAGAVGGKSPAQPTGTDKLAGTSDGARTAAGSAEAKPAPPPLALNSPAPSPEASARAAVTDAPDTAIALAATLAGLTVGQELRGQVRPLPGRPQALLTTPEGLFLIDSAPAAAANGSEAAVVLTRADRTIAGLLLAVDGAPLDPPQTVRLTLVALPARPAPAAAAAPVPETPISTHAPAAPAPALAPAPASARPAALPLQPMPPLPLDDRLLNSLLPGETLPLRGRGTVAMPSPVQSVPQPIPPRGDAPVAQPDQPATLAPAPSAPAQPAPATPAPAILRDATAGLTIRLAAAMLQADASARTPAPASGPDRTLPLSPLFEQGVLPVRLATPDKGQAVLAASLIAVAEAGEVTPLTRPAEGSPLARLAAAGRLITAVVLPPAAGDPVPPRPEDAPPAPKPEAAPFPATARGTSAPGAPPAPPPTLPGVAAKPAPEGRSLGADASVSRQPRLHTPAQPQIEARPQTETRTQTLQLASNSAVLEIDVPADAPRPAAGTQLVFLVVRGREHLPPAQPVQVPGATEPQPRGEAAHGAATPPPAGHADGDKNGTPAVATSETMRNAPSADLLWMPGVGAPPGPATLAPLPVHLHPGEALLVAVMQALGRKGFNAAPKTNPEAQGKADASAATDTGGGAPTRLAATPALHASAEARPTIAAEGRAGETLPDALPVTVTLQTPQGPVPLTMLVWQPVPPVGDDGRNGASRDAERETCFAVEVEFESVGLLRLRGTVTPRTLELAVETERPLDTALQRSATRDFTAAVEAGGMTGTLVFRHRQGR